jgi:protease I
MKAACMFARRVLERVDWIMQLENSLAGKKVAILVANGFEQSHMTVLHKSLVDTGAEVRIVSPEKGVVNSWHDDNWGHFFPANEFLPTAMSFHFDAVIVPGGARHVSRLSGDPQTTRFMRGFIEDNKPVALFGDASRILAVDNLAEERTVVSSEESREALLESGARIDEGTLCQDNMLCTAVGDISELVRTFVECARNYEPENWEAA